MMWGIMVQWTKSNELWLLLIYIFYSVYLVNLIDKINIGSAEYNKSKIKIACD